MKKTAFILLLFSLYIYTNSTPLFAQVVSSNILIERAKEYDGQEVEFEGEVVGEVMKRGDFNWINVYDNFNAVGIWAKVIETNQIKFSGDYAHKGDTVLIKGIFHRACSEHGGDLDIHATRISKIREGRPIAHALPKEKSDAVTILLFLLLAVTILVLISQNKRKKHAQPHL